MACRASYDRVLIVSEGAKTEPGYFREIRSTYRLQTANVVVQPSHQGTAPIQVVEYARTLFERGDSQRRIAPRAFEQVFVVFDRDDHSSYVDAVRQASLLDGRLRNDNRQPVRFRAIVSVPCFELWFLLHYEDVLAPIQRQQVFARLGAVMKGYEKGAAGTFQRTQGLVQTAIVRAKAMTDKGSPYNEDGPYTSVHELVSCLLMLKR